jgi:predicted nucleic acid-binding protein
MRVFLDANVLFSAAYLTTGSPRALFSVAAAGACQLLTSEYAAEEARRNIALKQPRAIAELADLLYGVALAAEPSVVSVSWATSLGLPAKDAPIMAAAVNARCHLLVTGDVTHFGALFGVRHRGTVVMRPADALAVLV